jgi:hypothetical protein
VIKADTHYPPPVIHLSVIRHRSRKAEATYIYNNDGKPSDRTAATEALSSSTSYATTCVYDDADQLTGLTDRVSSRLG